MIVDDVFYSSVQTTDDCLTFAFITLCECFLWCLQMIYELFFQSFWQVFVYLLYNDEKREKRSKVQCGQQKNNSSVMLTSVRSSYCQTEPSLPNKTGERVFDPKSAAFLLSSQQQRHTHEKIPNVHSNQTLNKIDSFLNRYIHKLYSDTHHLRQEALFSHHIISLFSK